VVRVPASVVRVPASVPLVQSGVELANPITRFRLVIEVMVLSSTFSCCCARLRRLRMRPLRLLPLAVTKRCDLHRRSPRLKKLECVACFYFMKMVFN
jgi:hypothetical protein